MTEKQKVMPGVIKATVFKRNFFGKKSPVKKPGESTATNNIQLLKIFLLTRFLNESKNACLKKPGLTRDKQRQTTLRKNFENANLYFTRRNKPNLYGIVL